MGYMGALSMAEEAGVNEQTMLWHLQSNHYPPVPASMVPICMKAIKNANNGEFDKLVKLPKGISYRGKTSAPTSAIVEAHHLDAFIEYEDY